MSFSGNPAGATAKSMASNFHHVASTFKSLGVSLRNAKAATTNAMVKSETIDAGLKDLLQQLEALTVEIPALASDSSAPDFDALRAMSAAIYNDSRSLLSSSLSSNGRSLAMAIRHVSCRAMEAVAHQHTPQALLQVVRCWVRVGLAWEAANQLIEAKECFSNAWSCVNSIGGPAKVASFIMGLEAEQALRCLLDASIHKAGVEWALFSSSPNDFHFAEESYLSLLKALDMLPIIPTTTASDRFLIVDTCVACAAHFMENRRWADAAQWLRASLQGCEDCLTVTLDAGERGQVQNRRFRVLLALAFAYLEERLAGVASTFVMTPDYFAEPLRYLQLADAGNDAGDAPSNVPLQLYIRSRVDIATGNLEKGFQGIQALIQSHAATACVGMADSFPMVLSACAAFASASRLSDDAFTLYSVAAKTFRDQDRACTLRVELISQMLLATDGQTLASESHDRLAKFVSKVADDHISGKLPITNEKHVQRMISIVEQLFDRASADQMHETALAWGLRALQLQSGHGSPGLPRMFETCSRLSTIYFSLGDVIHAVQYAERALSLQDAPAMTIFALQLRIEEICSAMRLHTLVDVYGITASMSHVAGHQDICFLDKMGLLSSVVDAVQASATSACAALMETVINAGVAGCNVIMRAVLKKMTEEDHEYAVVHKCLFAARHLALSAEAATIPASTLFEFVETFLLLMEHAPKCNFVSLAGVEMSSDQLSKGLHAALALFIDLARSAGTSTLSCKAWLCTCWLAFIGVMSAHRPAEMQTCNAREVYADIACIAHTKASWDSMQNNTASDASASIQNSFSCLLDMLEQIGRDVAVENVNFTVAVDLCNLRQLAMTDFKHSHGCFVRDQQQSGATSLLCRVPLLELQSLLKSKTAHPSESFANHVGSVTSNLVSNASAVCLHPRHLEWLALHFNSGSNSDPVVARSLSGRALEAISASSFGIRQYSMPTAARLCRLLVSTAPTKTDTFAVLEKMRAFVHTSLMILGTSSQFQPDMLFPPEELDYAVCTAWNHGVFFWQTEVADTASKLLSWAISMLAPLQSLCQCQQAVSAPSGREHPDLVALSGESTMRAQYTAFLAASKLPMASALSRSAQVLSTVNQSEVSEKLDPKVVLAWRNEARLPSTPLSVRSKGVHADLHASTRSSISSFRAGSLTPGEAALQASSPAHSVPGGGGLTPPGSTGVPIEIPKPKHEAVDDDISMRTAPLADALRSDTTYAHGVEAQDGHQVAVDIEIAELAAEGGGPTATLFDLSQPTRAS